MRRGSLVSAAEELRPGWGARTSNPLMGRKRSLGFDSHLFRERSAFTRSNAICGGKPRQPRHIQPTMPRQARSSHEAGVSCSDDGPLRDQPATRLTVMQPGAANRAGSRWLGPSPIPGRGRSRQCSTMFSRSWLVVEVPEYADLSGCLRAALTAQSTPARPIPSPQP
jgi:hypothetical protein